LYDYGAKFSDPSLNQRISVDPLAEEYPGYFSYNYVIVKIFLKTMKGKMHDIFFALIIGTLAGLLSFGVSFNLDSKSCFMFLNVELSITYIIFLVSMLLLNIRKENAPLSRM